ncbi:MAG: zf-HC2 domain-containing protein [Oscillospiraceae bacterium]|nr:zf-HC2 domain-containing protein [Oscillospiraceae bacterium]
MNKISCGVCRDLLPLVQDGVACEDSRRLVEEHLAACPDCRALEVGDVPIVPEKIDDHRVLSSIRRGLTLLGLFLLVAGAVLGVALSNSMGMFYNFALMPLLGALGYFFLSRRWPWLPAGVLLLSLLWIFFSHFWDGTFAEEGFQTWFLSDAVFYSVIYTVLVLLGVLIAALLRFAFRKEEAQ